MVVEIKIKIELDLCFDKTASREATGRPTPMTQLAQKVLPEKKDPPGPGLISNQSLPR